MGPGDFLRNHFRLYRLWILERDLGSTSAREPDPAPANVEIRFLDRHARRDWICQHAGREADWPQFRAALLHDHDLVVAWQDGEPIGWAWIGYVRVFLPPLGREICLPAGTAYLYEAFVRPSARGRGIGRALVGARCARAASLGYGHLLTHVLDGNLPSLRALRTHGFTTSGRTRFLRALLVRVWTRSPLPAPSATQS